MLFFEETIALRTNKTLLRSQIWNALWQKVEQPELFTPNIIKHQSEIIKNDKNNNKIIRRELDFGTHKIYDLISYEQESWINFEIIPNDDLHASGALKILIISDNNNNNSYSLKFVYNLKGTHHSAKDDVNYIEYLKSAYRQADLDCIKVVRSLVLNERK